jgi:2-desacetyl-2-hydroxyethyl bacteriochlorophyllide A dehydrogenase
LKKKTILFTAPYTAEMIEEEINDPDAGEVQVKLVVSTISSGTERANLVGEINVSGAQILDKAYFPRHPGYSSSGVIVKVGSNVKDYKIGDRVALSWSVHSQYCNMPVSNVRKIYDDSIPFEEAALWHISTFPLAAIRKCGLELGESALVMGVGVLGIIGIKQLKVAGAAPIIAVDPKKEKRELALSIGADYAFDPYDKEFAKKVKEITNGGANVCLEVTGVGAGLNGALDCMAPFGRVALLGCTRSSDFNVDFYHKVHAPGISLIGAHTMARPKCESSPKMWTEFDDVMAMQRLFSTGRLKLGDLVEETHSPSGYKEVYERLASEPTFPIVQFDWRLLNE